MPKKNQKTKRKDIPKSVRMSEDTQQKLAVVSKILKLGTGDTIEQALDALIKEKKIETVHLLLKKSKG